MCVDEGEASFANRLHLMEEADSSGFERAIKVRKPYIITKQREKWTEEEHNKFLEALKLYGRAWRRIEEHIGSKTAVQIRSHAQKFFSKVTRESSSSCPGTVKAIEIPPPRPKRKPNHPYPRKLGHLSVKKGPLIDEQLWSSMLKQSVSEQESKSPTSVLSVYGAGEETLVEQGSQSKSLSSSAEFKADQSTDPSAILGIQDASPMESDSGIQDSLASKEAPFAGQQITSLKLFGSTVIVTNSLQQSLSDKNEFEYQESFLDNNKIDLGSQKLEEKAKFDAVLGESSGDCNPVYGGIQPMAYCLFSQENFTSPLETNMASYPSWWNSYGGMPFSYSAQLNTKLDQSPPHLPDDKFVHGDSISKESAHADSSMSSDRNSWSAHKNCHDGGRVKELPSSLVLKPSKNSAFSSLRASSVNSTQGFMPYKRCVVDKELQHKPVVACGKGSSYRPKVGCQ